MSTDPPIDQGGYIPKGVRFFQKAIKHRDNALNKEERERKRGRDKRLRDLKREAKRQLLPNIEEIDSELQARIDDFSEDGGILWDCGSGERGEELLLLLYSHYQREGLTVWIETRTIQVKTECFEGGPTYFLRIRIPEVAEYQKSGGKHYR